MSTASPPPTPAPRDQQVLEWTPPPTMPPTMPPAPPRRRQPPLKAWHWLLIGLGVLVLVAIIGGLVGSAFQSRTLRPAPTATVQPSLNPNASAPAYRVAVLAELHRLESVVTQAATDCSADVVTACRNDLQAVHDAIAAFRKVLEQHPAPPGLQPADTLFHAALTAYHDGVTLVMQGLDHANSSDVEAGGRLFAHGNTQLQDGAAAFDHANCTSLSLS